MESGFDMEFRTCPVCGKTFIPAAQHIYKAGNKLACSYTCHRKAEKNTNGRQGQGKRVEQYTLDGEYIQSFDRGIDAVNMYGFPSLDRFYIACRNGEAYKGYIWKYAEEVED